MGLEEPWKYLLRGVPVKFGIFSSHGWRSDEISYLTCGPLSTEFSDNYLKFTFHSHFCQISPILIDMLSENITQQHLIACGRAVAQRLDAGFPPRRPGFAYGQHVVFVVDKAALVQVFSEYFGFPC
jgi:hypothetical protein